MYLVPKRGHGVGWITGCCKSVTQCHISMLMKVMFTDTLAAPPAHISICISFKHITCSLCRMCLCLVTSLIMCTWTQNARRCGDEFFHFRRTYPGFLSKCMWRIKQINWSPEELQSLCLISPNQESSASGLRWACSLDKCAYALWTKRRCFIKALRWMWQVPALTNSCWKYELPQPEVTDIRKCAPCMWWQLPLQSGCGWKELVI